MAGNVTVDEAWAALANVGETVRETVMEQRYQELAKLDEETRRTRLRPMANVEYTLKPNEIQRFHLSRLRVWLELESETAEKVASSYEQVLSELPGEIGIRRVTVVQALASGFRLAEQARLRALVPSVFAGVEERGADVKESPNAKRPWWAWWKLN